MNIYVRTATSAFSAIYSINFGWGGGVDVSDVLLYLIIQ